MRSLGWHRTDMHLHDGLVLRDGQHDIRVNPIHQWSIADARDMIRNVQMGRDRSVAMPKAAPSLLPIPEMIDVTRDNSKTTRPTKAVDAKMRLPDVPIAFPQFLGG